MNAMIRRLALMLGILVPGFLMIVVGVDPLVLLVVVALVAIGILFVAGSLTIADLKGLRRKAKDQQVKAPVKQQEPASVQGETRAMVMERGDQEKKQSRFRGISSVFGNLGIVFMARWHSLRRGKSGIEEIDQALDRAVSSPAGGILPPVPKVAGGGTRAEPPVSSGDPFEDLLNTSFEPDLLEDGLLGMEVPELEVPGQNIPIPGSLRTGPQRKEERIGRPPEKAVSPKESPAPGPTGMQPGKAASPVASAVVKKEATSPGQQVKAGVTGPLTPPVTSTMPPAAPPKPKEIVLKDSREGSGKDAGTAPQKIPGASPVTQSPPPGQADEDLFKEMREKGKTGPGPTADPEAAAQEILSFTPESGGTMDDLLASLKADATRVKRTDDSSLLRNMKGTKVRGKELVEDLSSLLKELN